MNLSKVYLLVLCTLASAAVAQETGGGGNPPPGGGGNPPPGGGGNPPPGGGGNPPPGGGGTGLGFPWTATIRNMGVVPGGAIHIEGTAEFSVEVVGGNALDEFEFNCATAIFERMAEPPEHRWAQTTIVVYRDGLQPPFLFPVKTNAMHNEPVGLGIVYTEGKCRWRRKGTNDPWVNSDSLFSDDMHLF